MMGRKLSHRKLRAEWKKQRRKEKRQKLAQERNSSNVVNDDDSEEETVDIEDEVKQRSLRLLAEEQWIERERVAQEQFAEKKRREEQERQKREERERRIREEWEERERKEKEEEEQRQKQLQQKKERQEKLLEEATANENKSGAGPWSNPLAPERRPGVERKVDKCPFFVKTAACRFGDRCSRLHEVPDTSTTLVFPGMYNHYSLDQALRGEYDIDIDLEYEDSDTYRHFEEFYGDVLPEFKSVGTVLQFKVCRNFEPHLKGNVYVQYSCEEEALRAYALFNARWYGGRQLTARFADIASWRAAICGQYHHKKCIKGRACNFLHVFINPSNEFRGADRDYGNFTPSVRSQGNSSRRHGNDYRHHDSKNGHSRPRGREFSRVRSRSRERTNSRSRARSRSRDRNRARSRSNDRKRSKARSRSRDRRHSKARSRSRERKRDRPRSVSRERTHSKGRSRSRGRTHSKARSRSRDRTHRSRSGDRASRKKRRKSRSPVATKN